MLRPKTMDGVSLPPKHISVEMEVVKNDIRISPAEVYFGGTRVGSTAQSIVSVSSRNGLAVQIEKVSPIGGGLSVAPGDRANEFRVKQQIAKSGSITGVVSFTVRTKTGVEQVDLNVGTVGVEVSDK